MRPYLAILRDSFHEALASRVLWVLLILTAVFLLIVAPFGVYDRARSEFEPFDFTDVPALLRALNAGGDSTPAFRVQGMLSDEIRPVLTAPFPEGRREQFGIVLQLSDEFNALLDRPDLYDAVAWTDARLSNEARGLQAAGLESLEPEQLARFNRLALEAAFPQEIAESGGERRQLYYLKWDLMTPISERNFDLGATLAVNFFMEGLVGVIGIFIAILVTASIIPHTYDAGAIDLLLSKPVSRALVFLTKYLGGCAFILIIGSVLVVGFWLILGWRLEIWNHKLLLCIPIYLFLFGIYYAVSALAGVLWRNAIVCVVMSIVFWLACTVLGAVRTSLDNNAMRPDRITRLVLAGDDLLSVNENADVQRWNAETNAWDPVFVGARSQTAPMFMAVAVSPVVGPVYDGGRQRLLAVDSPYSQAGSFSAGSPLWVGAPETDWMRERGLPAPAGTEALFVHPDGDLVAVAASGIFRLQGDPIDNAEKVKVLGFDVRVPGQGGGFVPAGDELRPNSPLSAAMHPQSDNLVIFDGARLVLLAAGENDEYREQTRLDFEPREPGVVAFAGDTILLALKSGEVRVYNTRLELLSSAAAHAAIPRFASASPDGRWFAVVFHDRVLWLFDAVQGAPVSANLTGQGDISAADFTPRGTLLVADRQMRVIEYNPATWQAISRRSPSMDVWALSYRYVVNPLYTVFPRPGELGNMISKLLLDEQVDDLLTGMRGDDLTAARLEIDYWGPIWSNLAFVAIILALGCLYVARKDF